MSKGPALYLAPPLDMKGTTMQRTMDNRVASRYQIKDRPLSHAHGVEIFEKFTAEHDVRVLPELAVTCKIPSLRLY